MDCWAIIPIKSFALGKSRLAPVLSAEQRAALNRHLFGRVLEAAQASFSTSRIVVITGDPLLLALARGHGLHGLEDPKQGLNAALETGCRHALERRARGLVVLSADLPLIVPADVKALVDELGDRKGCVIAPDDQEEGTNALAFSPPDPDFFRFGPASFQSHLEAARKRDLPIRILRRPGLAYDLDTPESYKRYAKGQLAPSGAPA
jgi:2-phospho-L-lactate guanylyltransferase